MKKYSIYVLFLISFSCTEKAKEVTITDFSTSINDTLLPNNNATYNNARFEIKGYSNDTIKVSFYGIERTYSGEIDHQWNSDYYGQSDVIFTFDPYNAVRGDIKIRYSIN